jgi:hypothetical protein
MANRCVKFSSLFMGVTMFWSAVVLPQEEAEGFVADAAAQEVAQAILSYFKKGDSEKMCRDSTPVVVMGGDEKSKSLLILKSVRKGHTPIQVRINPPVTPSSMPKSVSDALHRVQMAGGTVQEQESTAKESAAPLLAWAWATVAEAASNAVSSMLEASMQIWATNNFEHYNAVVFYIETKSGREYSEVVFKCK